MAPDSDSEAAGEEEEEEELVLVDVILEFMELIYLPGRSFEVVCVEAPEAGSSSSGGDDGLANGVYVGDHGSFFAIPMPPLRFPTPATSPPDQPTTPPLPPLTVRAPRPLPDGACLWDALRAAPRLVDDAFWLGLRYAADREVRPHLRFALFAQGFVRLFVLPQPEAHCVRCLVLTRRACMARDVRARLAEKACAVVEEDEDEDEEDALLGLDEDPPFLELLRACAVGPTAGSEWPGSGPVVVAGGDNDGDGDGSFRLHSHQRASLAWMRAVEGEAEKGAVVALAEACPPLTVGDGLLTIDCHGAVRTGAAAAAGYQRREQQRQKDWGEEEAIKLPRGGLLAHPVGAGKTAIAASLLLPNPSGDGGPTLILAPDHILFQWRRELAQVLSGRERPSFALVGFEELRQEWRQQERLEKLEQQQQSSPLAEAVDNDATEPAAVAAPSPAPASSSVLGRKWGRLILDEGQLVQQDEALYEAVLQRVHADVRWVLSATPDTGLRWLMSLVHGRELSHDECRQSRRAFVHRRTLRDPPAACLPLPLLRGQMVPVILSPEESQTLALANAMGESLERTVELALCPEWAVPLHSDDEGRAPEAVAAEGDGAQRFASFDAWYARAMAKHARRLAEARASVKTARALVAAQEARHAAALAAGRDAEPLESLTLVFEGREPPPPPPPPPTDGGSGGGHHRQPTARTPLPWSLGVYHHIGAHGGRPLYRYRRAGRYLAFVDGRWGLFEGDPTLDGAAATEAAAPAFVSGPEEAAARPDGVHIWYARPGLVRTMQEERGEVRDAEAHALARDVLVEREAGRLYPPAAAGHTGSSEELPAAVRYRGGWWRRVEGLAVEEDVMDRVEGVGEMADDERGVDDARWAAVDAAEARAAELQRAAAFCEGLHATMADGRTECAVCMAPLRGRAVTVLSCLHAFDDRCVRILGSMAAASSHAHGGGGATAATVACPICRRRTRRRDMATFLHRPSSLLSGAPPVAAAAGVLEADNDDAGMEVAAAPSSKLGAVCERILSILRGSGDDKVVVFLKWGYSLELLAACLDERGVPSLYLLGARHRHQQCHHAEQRSSSPQQQGSSSSSSSSHSGGCVALLSPLGPDARAVPEARALAAFNGHLKQAEEEEDGEEEEGEGRVVSVQELAAVRVLLLRLDEEAAGLNLNGANHVLLPHPYIDPSIQAAELVPLAEAQAFERQAVGRCHRYPQTRPVTVHRYYARGSVEEEMYTCWGLL